MKVEAYPYPAAPHAGTCPACGFHGEVSDFSIIAAEQDALVEEIGTLVSVEMYLQQQGVAFETFADSNDLDPITIGMLYTLSRTCHEQHETVMERRENMSDLYEKLVEE